MSIEMGDLPLGNDQVIRDINILPNLNPLHNIISPVAIRRHKKGYDLMWTRKDDDSIETAGTRKRPEEFQVIEENSLNYIVVPVINDTDSNLKDIHEKTMNQSSSNARPIFHVIRKELTDINFLHKRLGHAPFPLIKKLVEGVIKINGMPSHVTGEPETCEGCLMGKFVKSKHRATKTSFYKFHRIVSDICGKFPLSVNMNNQFITFIDDFSKSVKVTPIPDKSSVTVRNAFIDYMDWVRSKSKNESRKPNYFLF